jgi:HlyD family secretion protein
MGESSDGDRRKHLQREGAKGLGVVLVLVFLMMWLAGAFVSKVHPGPPIAKPKPPKVKTQKAELQVYPLYVSQVGSISAQNVAEVSSKIMAQVTHILVQPGDRIFGSGKEGEAPTVMARLDDRDIQARLHQAQSQLLAMEQAAQAAKAKLGAAQAQVAASRAGSAKALSDYHRYEDLYRHQAATGQQLDHIKAAKDIAAAQEAAAAKDSQAAQNELQRVNAQKEQANAAVAEARVMLSYTVIHAPFSGKLIKKMLNEGDMAIPGHPIFLVETSSRPELHSFVSESLLPHLKVGQSMVVHIDALDETLSGSLREIVPKADPSTRTVLVKVSLLPHPELVNGLFGQLQVQIGTYESIVIPFGAVREVGQLHLITVLDKEGYPERRFVTLGERHGDLVEVLSGLQKGEEVVVE